MKPYIKIILAICLFTTLGYLLLTPQQDQHKKTTTQPNVFYTKEIATTQKQPNEVRKKTTFSHTGKKFTTKQPDHAELLQEAKKLEKNKRRYRFAEAIPVTLNTNNSGKWQQQGNHDIWRLIIHSPGATSLNLGFKSYHMPEGGELSIHQPNKKSPYRSFTHSDNEAHGELWTPLLHGDKIIINVTLPIGMRNQLALQLSSINHGFRSVISRNFLKHGSGKIGGNTSGLCNIDAVCRSGDPNVNETLGPILDLYQDQIRSVAAYTINGIDTCSGALINNTSNNKTPYFLTADHCGIDSNNDSSAVFYFNFQNSYCRAPSSVDSAGIGDGNLSQFSTGSIFRAANASSDFCLVELDDPIPSSYDVFYAGWNRNNVSPTMAVGIHHPAVAEKRISVDVDSLSQNGNYWLVNDWDFGTTEGGSSGSPLFDSNQRIVGQLYGGRAACGNDLEDEYGKISSSWSSNNSSSRLSDWLDPANLGNTTLDGISHSPALTIKDTELTESDSGSTNMNFTITLSEVSNTSVTVDYQTTNDTATAGSDYTQTFGTLTFPPGSTEQTITIPILGDTTAEPDETFFLTLTNSSGAIIRKAQAIGAILTNDFTTPVLSGSTNQNASQNSTFRYQIIASNLPATFSLVGNYPLGMVIDSETGLIEWTPATTGTFSYTVRSENLAGSDTRTFNISVNSGTDTMSAIELANQGVELQMEGSLWSRQTTLSHDGSDALKSGNISHNEFSSFSITVNGPGSVNFWLSVSSEENYDFAYFILNGEIMLARSGDVAWEQHNYNLTPGINQLTWLYTKDVSFSEGSDAAWLDEVTFSGYTAWTAAHSIATAGKFDQDAEGDGTANGLEYATGLSPLIHDSHLLPSPVLETDQLLRISFTKPNGISGITYDAQVSDDLKLWDTTERSILTNSNTSFDAKQTLTTPAATHKFMRLYVYPTP